MNNIQTRFAGLTLCNPIIVSSSSLTNTAKKNKKWAEAGAGAIVLKSLFEEQIILESQREQIDLDFHTEGAEYYTEYFKGHKLAEYLDLIKDSKREAGIPIIASINCYGDSSWVSFAKEIEAAGADALEINLLALPSTTDYKYGEFEQYHVEVLKHLKEVVNLPIIMKLGRNLTSPVALASQLHELGAAAVVLFNRFYQPDIDIDKMEHTSGSVLSVANDFTEPLRWTGLLSGSVNIDIAISGGVANSDAVIKAILAGASAVEVCSALYRDGDTFIKEALAKLNNWMTDKQFDNIAAFKAKLNVHNVEGANRFERSQFIRYFTEKK